MIGGIASAVLFIFISAEVAEGLARRGYGQWVGALYGRIGIGMALSGLVIPLLDDVGGWDSVRIGMGLIVAFCATFGIGLGRRHDLVQTVTINTSTGTGSLLSIWSLAIAYFCEGLGYIVTATFLVAIIAATPELESFSPYSWVAAGLAALPSTILWPQLGRWVGTKPGLFCAFVLQAAGILVSTGAENTWEVLFAAIAFGSTFLGIVALTLAEGSCRTTAILTVCFSIGQMLDPIAAGIMADLQHGFTLPLLLATGCIIVGGLFMLCDRNYRHRLTD